MVVGFEEGTASGKYSPRYTYVFYAPHSLGRAVVCLLPNEVCLTAAGLPLASNGSQVRSTRPMPTPQYVVGSLSASLKARLWAVLIPDGQAY